jgi:GDP-4-dehydro-6-deoxy-D-mannose reductase
VKSTAPSSAYHDSAVSRSAYLIELRDAEAVVDLMTRIQPDHIYHLAAQAFVPRSFEFPWETLENNILAQLNVIQACLRLNIQPRMLVVSSAEIYGVVKPEELPLREDAPFRPTSPYSVSKVAKTCWACNTTSTAPLVRRPFNHLNGRTSGSVTCLAMQIARIEAAAGGDIQVGDLSALRDFTDVRDIVRAYRLIMEKGMPGEAYNIASGIAYSIQTLLDTLLGFTSLDIRVALDPSRLRPAEIPVLRGDATRLYNATGWQPQIPFEQTLLDVLNHCRERIRKEEIST